MLGLSIALLALAVATVSSSASPIKDRSQAVLSASSFKPHNASRPLVIWHGLGDTAHSAGILGFIKDVQDIYPGMFVHSVKIPEEGTLEDERRAGFVSVV